VAVAAEPLIMRKAECLREGELLDALQTSRWPDACDPCLREHAAGCAACTELLALATALIDDQRTLLQEAQVPSSAIVWWRAQMRSRREAAERALRPISFVQGVAIACAAGLLATVLGIFMPTFRRLFAWGADVSGSITGLSLPPVSEALANPVVLAAVVALGLCALVLPLALYFAFQED
jgi:hypothetical protein